MAGRYRRQSRRLSVLSLGPWSRLSFSRPQPRRRWYCSSEDSVAHCRNFEEEFRTCGRLPDLEKTTPCIMGCLIYSLEKLSERKRRILFYIAFLIGGLLTLGGFTGFLTPQKGWAFIVVVSGVFILITTGILWDTMAHPTLSNPEACVENTSNLPSAPDRVEDEPPPDYDSVVRNKNLPRSNSKWSLYNQTWCPSFNPKMGYDKTATMECSDVVTDAPPSYNQSQALPQTQPEVDDMGRRLGVAPAAIHGRTETTIEIGQK